MKSIYTFILTTVIISASNIANAQLLINEIKVNPPGNDNPFEFIELKGTPGSTINNTYFCIFEGDSSTAGTADLVIRLNNVTLGSNGLYFIGTNLGYTINAPTVFRDTLIFGVPGGIIENGSNTFMVVYSTTPIVYGIDYDANKDGVLELPPGAAVIDGFGWISGGTTNAILYSSAVLSQSTGTPDAAVRFYGNTTANSAAAWYCGDLVGTGASSTFDALEVSFNFPNGGALSPGDHNLPNAMGLADKNTSNTLVLFPNPTQNKLNLRGLLNQSTLEIYDINGKLVIKEFLKGVNETLDVSALENGIYFLRTFNQQEITTSKFQIVK